MIRIERLSTLRLLQGLLLLLFVALVPASPRTEVMPEDEVRRAAETYARNITRDARPDAVVESMEPYVIDGEALGYIAHLEGGGYCLCGVDDLVLPVYLYVPDGAYDPENPAVKCILWEIGERTRLYRSWVEDGGAEYVQRARAMDERATFWRELAGGRVPSRVIENKRIKEETGLHERSAPLAGEPDMMAINFTAKWGQGHPYNDMCPCLPPASGNRCLVGCVATAAAQIMYYWKWPITGEGYEDVFYHYYWRPAGNWDEEPLVTDPEITDTLGWSWAGRLEWTSTGGGKLRMSGDWDWSIKATAEDTNFVHKITPAYELALDALYGRMNHDSTYLSIDFSTATYDWSILKDTHADPPDPGDDEAAKLSYHVGIASEMAYGLRGSSSCGPNAEEAFKTNFRYDPDAVTWPTNLGVMTEEITWLRPVGIGGCYHMWVIHGYDKSTDPDRLFLRNMGWSGGGDGWYTVDNYCPVGETEHVIRIAPFDVVRFVGDTDTGDGSPDDPHISLNEALLSAPDGATLIFRAGTDNPYYGSELVIDRPLTLMGEEVTIYLY